MAIGVVGSLWINVWHDEPTHAACDLTTTSLLALHRKVGAPVPVLCVLSPTVRAAFSAEARDAGVRSTAAIREAMSRGAIVIEHRGMLASVLASVSTGILLLARARSVRVFLDLDEAVQWLGSDAGAPPHAVLDAVAHIRG
jgi:hypothetical protein